MMLEDQPSWTLGLGHVDYQEIYSSSPGARCSLEQIWASFTTDLRRPRCYSSTAITPGVLLSAHESALRAGGTVDMAAVNSPPHTPVAVDLGSLISRTTWPYYASSRIAEQLKKVTRLRLKVRKWIRAHAMTSFSFNAMKQ
ncbi:hypothetical protein MC885_010914 [Smutsia gigantea]|nr:hypothetical protein MC885_010914 [Smutsia gigantea]